MTTVISQPFNGWLHCNSCQRPIVTNGHKCPTPLRKGI